MSPSQPPTPCAACGHSAWVHREEKQSQGNPIGLADCRRPGCDCRAYGPPS